MRRSFTAALVVPECMDYENGLGISGRGLRVWIDARSGTDDVKKEVTYASMSVFLVKIVSADDV